MKLRLFVLTLIALLVVGGQLHAADFPSKPLKIVVYTNPGGLVDISARKLAQILEKEYVKTPVVVENKKGAGGLVAIQHVVRQPADGHTLFALTSSVISKAVEAKQEAKLSQLEMLVRLIDDYECLIVRKSGRYKTLEALNTAVKDPKVKTVWAGPAAGGTDHLFAMKYWKAVSGKGTWIPYKSGGEAIAALMGGHADVYVGNSQDIKGRKGLKILAVAAPERIEQFKDAPTFEELGLASLTGESLWRGFAIKKSTNPTAKTELVTLLKKATENPEWKAFVSEGGANAIFQSGKPFEELVFAQISTDKGLLSSLKASS